MQRMPGTPRPVFTRSLLTPRLWPAWIGVGVMKLLAMLPFKMLMAIGRALGAVIERYPSPRRKVAATNIALCFPDLDAKAQARLVDTHLRDIGLMLIEFALGWMGSDRAIAKIPVRFEGLEHLEAAHAAGRGVLLVGGHFSHLELCARLVSQRIRIAGMYRRMDNPVFEWAVLRARLGYARAMFDKDDIRGTVKYLRGGGTLWYAPDQDMRSKDNVFVPFFGVPAATITATHHLARMSHSVVMPFFHRRLPGSQGYVLRLGAPLEGVPSADIEADTFKVNQSIEQMVREAPEQYLWVHKRFKTRPDGYPQIY
ncbi:LpxL/LpxP family Kdo(2)-lipid IV(A) lauroyl/palmitoleoyl acyltransferase [Dyella caseinilytica]|uniref:Lipid A biosynthesis acyltransferase n=1 Tax=Dyella caseinilytica TaxID=1849581 RepID=A0ABX7GVU7_9GAMM|nr:LpxL/LpxP family Kdo(2)-lipid IV(A) lauroyl/palmitoleoyl acyltransferase [Dyella caseinilytica]QRN54193.1 LpxL/LpxP family Kdo(2)-lipid IV(A) lauroyl/palmitoleoyl acyltransferase [Dyella caseinilytica]GFZ92250.1 lipid A biosynthesis lauroyltransferase [Dyella caseinilytica]